MHRRYLFAESDNFLLYDFYTGEGFVNEDVFAFSNRHGDEKGLVIYHNKFAETAGWIKTSATYLDKGSGDLRQRSMAEGLALHSRVMSFPKIMSPIWNISARARNCGAMGRSFS